MVIFLTAAVTIFATKAAGRVGKLNQGPWAPEGAPGLNGFQGARYSLLHPWLPPMSRHLGEHNNYYFVKFFF